MEHSLFKKWLLVLRSDQFGQVQGRLYGICEPWRRACAYGVVGLITQTNNHVYPTHKDITEALRSEGIPVTPGPFVLGVNVMELNDEFHMTFPEIADELERAYYEWRNSGTPSVQELAAAPA